MFYQSVGLAYAHAMKDLWQTPDEARTKACQFIRKRLETYQRLRASADGNMRYRAYMALGEALHPVMDSTSPAHRGWQTWNPFDFKGVRNHGDFSQSIENLSALTPQLMAESTRRIQEIMLGVPCECVLR